jgi:hypothetical protein
MGHRGLAHEPATERPQRRLVPLDQERECHGISALGAPHEARVAAGRFE